MKWKLANKRTLLNIIGGMILLLGLGLASQIYLTAEDDSSDVVGYEQGYGSYYKVRPDDSKKFRRDMELYGGKLNVLFYELRTWFQDLWQGKSLAIIIAGLTVIVSGGIFRNAAHLAEQSTPGDKQEDDGEQ